MIRLVSWNVNGGPWISHVAAPNADAALLQEAKLAHLPNDGTPIVPEPGDGEWRTAGFKTGRTWRTAIAGLSDRTTPRPHRTDGLDSRDRTRLAVGRHGTLAACDLLLDEVHQLTLVSWYATWEHVPGRPELLGADNSAHRLLSDLGGLVNSSRGHRIVATGDLNILHGYGEYGNPYWSGRYATVFDRAQAMGLRMVGPQYPHGCQADPWPEELPTDSRNVPTYQTSRQGPAGATRQLDFVFASAVIADRVKVTALNNVNEWGPSDHCRISIEIDLPVDS